MAYIVYTEIFTEVGFERWYYGTYATRERANEVALELGHTEDTFHCVCAKSDATELGILNLPN